MTNDECRAMCDNPSRSCNYIVSVAGTIIWHVVRAHLARVLCHGLLRSTGLQHAAVTLPYLSLHSRTVRGGSATRRATSSSSNSSRSSSPAAPAADGGDISDVVSEPDVEPDIAIVLAAVVARPPDASREAEVIVPVVARPPAKSKANTKAAVIVGSGPPAKPKAKAPPKAAVMAGSGPPAKSKAKAKPKAAVIAGSGPPAKAEAKATAESAVTVGSGPPAKASAEVGGVAADMVDNDELDDFIREAMADLGADDLSAVAKAGGLGADGNDVGIDNGKGDGKGKDTSKPMFAEYVRCQSCDRFEHFQRCRLYSKQLKLWRCSGCHVKTTHLYR